MQSIALLAGSWEVFSGLFTGDAAGFDPKSIATTTTTTMTQDYD